MTVAQTDEVLVPGPSRRRRVTVPPARLATLVVGVALWVLLLHLYGYWFGRSQPPLMTLHGAGVIECLRAAGVSSLWTNCQQLGAPAGLPLLTGLPEIYLGWATSYLPFVDPWAAHQLSGALVTGVSLLAGYLLMRRWDAPRAIALGTSVAYLASPAVLAINGQAYTFSGFVLLPGYVYVTFLLLDRLAAGRRVVPAAGAVVLALVMAFTDAYTFLIGGLVVACLVVGAALRREVPLRSRIWAAATFLAAFVIAAAAYAAYVPEETSEIPVGIGAFRYLGLDVITLVAPQTTLWWGALAGVPSWSHLWGDGTNVRGNYLGLLSIALVVWLVWRGRHRVGRTLRAELVPLLAAAGIALVLSLGPALKVNSEAQPVTPTWDVPAEMTTAALPTEWLYENAPALTSMRATYRWVAATKLVVVVLSGMAVTVLWRSRRPGWWPRTAAVALGVLVLADTAPNVPAALTRTSRAAQHLTELRSGIIDEASSLVRDGERMLMLPSRNDFLANGLAPFTGGTAYNAAPDKNYAFARSQWPASVTAVVDGWDYADPSADLVCAVLQEDADVVVLTYIDPYHDVVSSRRDPEREANYRWVAAVLAEDARFVADEGEWLMTLRASGDGC